MIRVAHIITGLTADGAERMLQSLVGRMDRAQFCNEVITLTGIGDLGADLVAAGVPVTALGMRKSVSSLQSLRPFAQSLYKYKPHVVQTWMYHADLLGGVFAKVATRKPVIWGVHHSSLDLATNKLSIVAIAKACAALSSVVPSKIVYCSEASERAHVKAGYLARRTEVIPNGFDTSKFKPSMAARVQIREELGLAAETLVIGMAARFHPHKDHKTFIRAAGLLSEQMPHIHFVLCGRDVNVGNRGLAEVLRGTPVERNIHLLGERQDMDRVLAAMDIASSSSRTEAFPLAMGEAMACGVPCVVTNVGDSSLLVAGTGAVVPAENPAALSAAWYCLLQKSSQERKQLGEAARVRVEQHFSLPAITRRYENLYSRVAASRSRICDPCCCN